MRQTPLGAAAFVRAARAVVVWTCGVPAPVTGNGFAVETGPVVLGFAPHHSHVDCCACANEIAKHKATAAPTNRFVIISTAPAMGSRRKWARLSWSSYPTNPKTTTEHVPPCPSRIRPRRPRLRSSAAGSSRFYPRLRLSLESGDLLSHTGDIGFPICL